MLQVSSPDEEALVQDAAYLGAASFCYLRI